MLSSLPIYSPSRALSIVRICSSRTVDSVLRPFAVTVTWVGRAVFVFLLVIAATIVVGLFRKAVAVGRNRISVYTVGSARLEGAPVEKL